MVAVEGGLQAIMHITSAFLTLMKMTMLDDMDNDRNYFNDHERL